MDREKVKNIVLAVSILLVIALTAGFIYYAVYMNRLLKSKPNEGGNAVQTYELGGTVCDGNGNIMLADVTYSMPRAMTFSELEQDTVAMVTINATVSPENATDNTVNWSIVGDDGFDMDDYLTITPINSTGTTAVLTCFSGFDTRAILRCSSNADSQIYDECYIDYLREFYAPDLDIDRDEYLAFGGNTSISVDYDSTQGYGTVNGYCEYGELSLRLDYDLIWAIGDRLGVDYEPVYKSVSTDFSDDNIPYVLTTPYDCFARGTGIDADKFNLEFARAVYFGEYEDYPVYISFTTRYCYNGRIIETQRITVDSSYEKIGMYFSLDGLYVAVDDVVIVGGDITIGVDGKDLTCYFDSSDSSAIATNNSISVSGNQMSCAARNVPALDKTFTKCLKMESNTKITFTTASDMTLRIYADTADKRIKVDGTNYSTETDDDGNIFVTVRLTAGEHTITKGDVLGIFALTLTA